MTGSGIRAAVQEYGSAGVVVTDMESPVRIALENIRAAVQEYGSAGVVVTDTESPVRIALENSFFYSKVASCVITPL